MLPALLSTPFTSGSRNQCPPPRTADGENPRGVRGDGGRRGGRREHACGAQGAYAAGLRGALRGSKRRDIAELRWLVVQYDLLLPCLLRAMIKQLPLLPPPPFSGQW